MENAVATRRAATLVPSIAGLRLSPIGCRAALVNISTSGLLASSDTRVPPGTTVTVLFEGTFSPPSADGRVTRCEVAALDAQRGLLYHVGIAFSAPLVLDDEPISVAPEPLATPARTPLRNRW